MWEIKVNFPLPKGITVEEDSHFIYVLREGKIIAILSSDVPRITLIEECRYAINKASLNKDR